MKTPALLFPLAACLALAGCGAPAPAAPGDPFVLAPQQATTVKSKVMDPDDRDAWRYGGARGDPALQHPEQPVETP